MVGDDFGFRALCEVCLELGFPVSVLSRSPVVLRDLDLLQAIQEKAAAVVVFGIISTPNSPGYDRVREMDHFAWPRRLQGGSGLWPWSRLPAPALSPVRA